MRRPIIETTPSATIEPELVLWMRRRLETGTRLDSALLAHMESTFGITDPRALLVERHGSETDSFLELLFSPDMADKAAFESQWGNRRFDQGTVAALLDALAQTPVVATLSIAGGNTSIAIEVPDFARAAFVQRLKLDWQPPLSLAAVWNRLAEDPRAIVARVLLRHARVAWHPNQVRMMSLLFETIAVDADDFESCLAFVLSLLPELEPQADPFAFLVAKKRFFFQSMCKAEAFERQRSASNMEILMLQGARAAHGTITHWRHQMGRIDRICLALFGDTRYFPPPRTEQLRGPRHMGDLPDNGPAE